MNVVFVGVVFVLAVVSILGAIIILSGRDTVGGDVLDQWRASRDGRKTLK